MNGVIIPRTFFFLADPWPSPFNFIAETGPDATYSRQEGWRATEYLEPVLHPFDKDRHRRFASSDAARSGRGQALSWIGRHEAFSDRAARFEEARRGHPVDLCIVLPVAGEASATARQSGRHPSGP
ncbi:hypothetical protein N9L68_05460 [bacterium]|nr:hypothetical protein [bacterium]